MSCMPWQCVGQRGVPVQKGHAQKRKDEDGLPLGDMRGVSALRAVPYRRGGLLTVAGPLPAANKCRSKLT